MYVHVCLYMHMHKHICIYVHIYMQLVISFKKPWIWMTVGKGSVVSPVQKTKK